jgi:ABC-type Fe3+ transport system permease subunit
MRKINLLDAINSTPVLRRGSRVRLSSRATGDSCGCLMGARVLGVALAASLAWYGWHWRTSIHALWSACWHTLLISFGGAVVGKLVGIFVYRLRESARTRARVAAVAANEIAEPAR